MDIYDSCIFFCFVAVLVYAGANKKKKETKSERFKRKIKSFRKKFTPSPQKFQRIVKKMCSNRMSILQFMLNCFKAYAQTQIPVWKQSKNSGEWDGERESAATVKLEEKFRIKL